jgi:hypothetical protein
MITGYSGWPCGGDDSEVHQRSSRIALLALELLLREDPLVPWLLRKLAELVRHIHWRMHNDGSAARAADRGFCDLGQSGRRKAISGRHGCPGN